VQEEEAVFFKGKKRGGAGVGVEGREQRAERREGRVGPGLREERREEDREKVDI
jgi:hypothetical protein